VEDIEEDWDEILENFDIEDIDTIVADAQENLFEIADVIEITPAKQLLEVAKYLGDED